MQEMERNEKGKRMDIKKGFSAAALLLASMVSVQAEAQAVYAYVAETVPANSDVLVSVPVNNSIEVELTTSSVAGSVITVPNTPDFAAGDFDAGSFVKYYVRFIDGPAAGLWASVTANSETTLTIDNAAVAALASAGGGDQIRVYKHHTLDSVFPAELLGVSFVDQTQVLLYGDADTQNKAPGAGGIFTYATFFNLGWGVNAERPLLPEQAFVIRNSSNTDLTFAVTGIAPDHPVAYLLDGGVAKDTAIGTGYPVPVTVESSGLGGEDQRQILLQGTSGQNQTPGSAGIFTFATFFNLGWGVNAGVPLAPNSALILRQPATDVGGVSTVVSPY